MLSANFELARRERAPAQRPREVVDPLRTDAVGQAALVERGDKLPSGLLRGVPFAIKDMAAVAGLPTSRGSQWAANTLAKINAPLVDADLAAGLNIMGKINTPEFGLIGTTESVAQPLPSRLGYSLRHMPVMVVAPFESRRPAAV